MKAGAQLFTVRELCQTLDGFADTLQRVADIGYTTVQVSGTCAYEPAWLKEQLQKTGLQCILTHVRPPEDFVNDTARVIADHKVFDCQYLGLGSFGLTDEANNPRYPLFVESYRPVTQALKEAGQYFMYHNHDHEFYRENGVNLLQRMAADFPADELGFTFDVYWAQTAGADPAFWLEELKGRVPCIHIKDRDYRGNFAALGEGNLNLARIFKKAELAGTDYMFVEQDECYGKDPIECLKVSYDYLKATGIR